MILSVTRLQERQGNTTANHSWPAHRSIILIHGIEDSSAMVLSTVNNCSITHLLALGHKMSCSHSMGKEGVGNPENLFPQTKRGNYAMVPNSVDELLK